MDGFLSDTLYAYIEARLYLYDEPNHTAHSYAADEVSVPGLASSGVRLSEELCGAWQVQIMTQAHTFLDRNALLLRASGEEAGNADYEMLAQAGLRKCVSLFFSVLAIF